jgi:hypothetical protein
MTTHDVERDENGFPCGWALGRGSYGFHRSFYRLVGRPAALGEYTRFRYQLRRKETAVQIAEGVFSGVRADTGEPLVVVLRGKGRYAPPSLVLPADWRPSPQDVPPDTPAPETPPPAPAPGRLSLGSKTAAAILEARLRGAGIATLK